MVIDNLVSPHQCLHLQYIESYDEEGPLLRISFFEARSAFDFSFKILLLFVYLKPIVY